MDQVTTFKAVEIGGRVVHPALQCVFVYGSLMSGMGNHRALGAAPRCISKCAHTSGRFEMADYGGFPGLYRPDDLPEPVRVWGELYLVDDAGLARLDCLEGHPRHYRREVREVAAEKLDRRGHDPVNAWVYVLRGSLFTTYNVQGCEPCVDEGMDRFDLCWRTWREYRGTCGVAFDGSASEHVYQERMRRGHRLHLDKIERLERVHPLDGGGMPMLESAIAARKRRTGGGR